jgi:hypothetical protein
MEDPAKLQQTVEAVRASSAAKGRTYADTGVEPGWLAGEISEHCKTRGWEGAVQALPKNDCWLVSSNHIEVLVEGSARSFTVKIADLNPVHLKTCLAMNGLLALTGAAIVALPMTGGVLWRAHARKAKIDSLMDFVDERVQSRSRGGVASSPSASVAERIKELVVLRDQGLITTEEFEAKRQELIKAL